MNKFVLGALALAASSTPCLAGSDSEWLTLDRDIESLASSLAPAASGASVSGFLRSSYASSSDVPIAGAGTKLGGFSIDDARLNFSGNVGNYSVFVSLEGSSDTDIPGAVGTAGPVGMLDAYATFPITDEIRGQAGQFKAPFLASSQHSEDRMLFIDRTIIGGATATGGSATGRDQGVMVSGAFEQLNWAVAIMNGNDGAGDDLAWSGRIAYTAMGHTSDQEGAYGATEETSLTVGVGIADDQDTLKDQALGIDAQFNMGALSATLEMVDLDTGIGDNTPWNFGVGYMISPDQFEGALRYEDFDDAANTTMITVGLNWYQSGHAAKFQFNYSTVSSDTKAAEIDVIQVGMTASI